MTERVITAVADAQGVKPHELRPSLYDVIDPDALEQLYADSQQAEGSDLAVTFAYGSWVVEIHSTGEVSVSERTTRRRPGGEHPTTER